jgi:hypothetical protein
VGNSQGLVLLLPYGRYMVVSLELAACTEPCLGFWESAQVWNLATA